MPLELIRMHILGVTGPYPIGSAFTPVPQFFVRVPRFFPAFVFP